MTIYWVCICLLVILPPKLSELLCVILTRLYRHHSQTTFQPGNWSRNAIWLGSWATWARKVFSMWQRTVVRMSSVRMSSGCRKQSKGLQPCNTWAISNIGVDTDLASCVKSSIMSTSGASGTRAQAHGVYCLLSSLKGSAAGNGSISILNTKVANLGAQLVWMPHIDGAAHSRSKFGSMYTV